jgi:hypothetical protein
LGIEPCIPLACLFLGFQLLSPMVPIGDLFRQAITHRSARFFDQGQATLAHVAHMLRHHLDNSIADHPLFQSTADPRQFRTRQQGGGIGFVPGERAVVKVGRILEITAPPVCIDLDKEHAPRDGASFARWEEAGVLNSMLKEKEHPGFRPTISFIDQDGTTFQQVTMLFQGQVDHGIEQWMTRADKRGQRLARRVDEVLLKADPLVALEDRITHTDLPIATTHQCRDVRNFIASRFPLAYRPA